MRAEYYDWHWRTPHDLTQSLQAIHPRHFQIERDHVGMKLLDFYQRERAIHSSRYDFDGRITLENCGNKFPHESGIIHYENAYSFAHAMASRGVVRAKRVATAATLIIKTTVPSPRIEAPLTKSLETISSGRALITNSSSPTRLSTTKPNRFS